MRRVFVLASLATALALLAPAAAGAGTRASTAREVAGINRDYHQAVAAQDAVAVGRLYAKNAKYITQDSRPVRGRAAIRSHLRQLMAQGLCNFRIHQKRLTVSGRLATGYGVYNFRVCGPDGTTSVKGSGYYVLTYQRQRNGSLKIRYDIFNDYPPLPPPALRLPRP